MLRFYRKDLIIKNFSNSYQKEPIVEASILRKKYLSQLGKTIAEILKGYSLTQDQLAKRFIFNNANLAHKHFDQQQSIILLLGHIGNWEWGQAVVSKYLKHNCVGVYKPLSNNSLNNYILKKRSQYGVKLLDQKSLLKYLISHPDEVNVYIFIADQYAPNAPRKQIDFLGQQSYFDASVEKIASKYKLPIIYADIKKVKDHSYETDLVEITPNDKSENHSDINKIYARLLEENIRRQPELWLWSHNRWK